MIIATVGLIRTGFSALGLEWQKLITLFYFCPLYSSSHSWDIVTDRLIMLCLLVLNMIQWIGWKQWTESRPLWMIISGTITCKNVINHCCNVNTLKCKPFGQLIEKPSSLMGLISIISSFLLLYMNEMLLNKCLAWKVYTGILHSQNIMIIKANIDSAIVGLAPNLMVLSILQVISCSSVSCLIDTEPLELLRLQPSELIASESVISVLGCFHWSCYIHWWYILSV